LHPPITPCGRFGSNAYATNYRKRLFPGLPDEKKGERLVVLHKLPDAGLPSCLEKLAQCDLPNLWKPRADQFFGVDNFPLLGTGKLDLRKVRELAAQLASAAD
jgi:hypothetical protein